MKHPFKDLFKDLFKDFKDAFEDAFEDFSRTVQGPTGSKLPNAGQV